MKRICAALFLLVTSAGAQSAGRLAALDAPPGGFEGLQVRLVDLATNTSPLLTQGLDAFAKEINVTSRVDWGRDGRLLVDSNPTGTNVDVWVVEPSGAARSLIQGDSFDGMATWSPDGTRIAFISSRDGLNDVFVADADGGNPVNLTQTSRAAESWPAWSPDGLRIAYNSRAGAVAGIMVMDADGSNPVMLHDPPGAFTIHDDHPDWSPDGTRIAFASNADGATVDGWDVFVMNADGSGVTNLTSDNEHGDWFPAWSPDGGYIAYARQSTFGQIPHLYVMSSTGDEPSLVRQYTMPPAWEPAPASTIVSLLSWGRIKLQSH